MSKKKIDKYLISTKPKQKDRIEDNFKFLNLNGMLASYERLIKEAIEKNLSFADFIENLQASELNWDEANRLERWIKQAGFEMDKTIDDKALVLELVSCRFIEKAVNVAFLGPTGVGKTHLATAVGKEAIYHGLDVKFLSLRKLNELIDKISDNSLYIRRLMNALIRPRLLILDEIALFQPNDILAKFLTELLLNRHLKASTIFTSNKSFGSWNNAFGDNHTSAMVLDRITQHMEPIDIDGPSYRLRDRLNTN